MKQFQLSELENQKLQNAALRAQIAEIQGRQAQERYETAMAESEQHMKEFCTRVGQDFTKVAGADPKTGMVSFLEEGEKMPEPQAAPQPAPKAEAPAGAHAQSKIAGKIKPNNKK